MRKQKPQSLKLALTKEDSQTNSCKRHPDDQWKLATPWWMSKGSSRSLRNLIRLICPEAGPDLSILEDPIEMNVRRMMMFMHPVMGRGLWMLPAMLDLAPIWRLKSLRRLHRLEPKVARKILHGIDHSRIPLISAIMMGIKAAVLTAYFDQDEVHRDLDYNHLSFLKERIALRKKILKGFAPGKKEMLSPFNSKQTGEK